MTKVDEHATVPLLDLAARRRVVRALDRPPVTVAYLFGSQARGTPGPLSDIDIAVVTTGAGADARADLQAAVVHAVGTNEVDLVFLEQAPPLLAHRVIRDGVRLLDRHPRARVAFETSALLTYLDTRALRATLAAGRRRRLTEGNFGRR